MNRFLNKNFLLESETAKTLYHNYAVHMPVIDYHCHIEAADIYNDIRFPDLTQIWLSGDHYKWRLMRSCGVDEEYITGNASAYEKFAAFAKILPLAIANPVYHWAHLELQRFFNIRTPLCLETAAEIWEQVKSQLNDDSSLSALGIMRKMNVETVITTDDPADSLEWHKKLSITARSKDKSKHTPAVLPCFRPDAVMNIDSKGFVKYIKKLNASITDYSDLKYTLTKRIEHFEFIGCISADHGIYSLVYAPAQDKEINRIFQKALRGENVTATEATKYRFAVLSYLVSEYARLDWILELHLGVLRDVSSLMSGKIGANTGFDCIGTGADIPQLAKVLDSFNSKGILPRTLIFSINPADNAAINTLAACFPGNGIKGKVQQGSAWWFNDSLGGIRQQLQCFAENGVLESFIGMLTDSRSFLSYTRHEYFRRILCNYIGQAADSGLYPADIELLGRIVQNISYYNVREYFRI